MAVDVVSIDGNINMVTINTIINDTLKIIDPKTITFKLKDLSTLGSKGSSDCHTQTINYIIPNAKHLNKA